MGEDLWKAIQRKQNRYLGGDGNTAFRGQEGADSYPRSYLVHEAKHRKKRPNWLWDAIQQAVEGKSDSQIPIAMFHFYGHDMHDDVVILRAQDFVRLMDMYEASLV